MSAILIIFELAIRQKACNDRGEQCGTLESDRT